VDVPAAIKPTVSTNEQLLEGVHVLVVDDDEDTLVLLQTVLSQHGAQVTAVSSVSEALQALAASPLDVLVSDISMPRHNGYELIHKVLTTPNKSKDIPAIAVTGYASHQDRDRVLAAGFRAYISKPFDPEDLVREIKTAIQNRLGS
jgi:CheY-like chemotaxis protein